MRLRIRVNCVCRYLPEVAHPFHVFTEAGYTVEFVSPKGGEAPVDPGSMTAFAKDEICIAFLANTEATENLKSTKSITDCDPSAYKAVFVAGGHGPMWDLPESKVHNKFVADAYEGGSVVAAVCHGTAGLLNVTLSSGKKLVDGHKITGFSNAEEHAVDLTETMPFSLETELVKSGATYTKADGLWGQHTVVDGSIVTGQNPKSATSTAEAVVKAIEAAA